MVSFLRQAYYKIPLAGTTRWSILGLALIASSASGLGLTQSGVMPGNPFGLIMAGICAVLVVPFTMGIVKEFRSRIL